eukprot:2895405-Rhodomonas_salina.2
MRCDAMRCDAMRCDAMGRACVCGAAMSRRRLTATGGARAGRARPGLRRPRASRCDPLTPTSDLGAPSSVGFGAAWAHQCLSRCACNAWRCALLRTEASQLSRSSHSASPRSALTARAHSLPGTSQHRHYRPRGAPDAATLGGTAVGFGSWNNLAPSRASTHSHRQSSPGAPSMTGERAPSEWSRSYTSESRSSSTEQPSGSVDSS